MENENLTNLTKGIIHFDFNLPVPIKQWCVGDDDTVSRQVVYKICRYVGTSCRVIGTCNDFDEAFDKLFYWRDRYKSHDIFIVKSIIE